MAKTNINAPKAAEQVEETPALTLEQALEKIAELEGELADAAAEIDRLVKDNELLTLQKKGAEFPTFEAENGDIYELTVPVNNQLILPQIGEITGKDILENKTIQSKLIRKESSIIKLVKKGGEQ